MNRTYHCRQCYWTVCCFLFLPSAWLVGWAGSAEGWAAATEPSATATVSKDTVQVAEPFQLEITVRADVGSRVIFPTVPTNLGEFDVRKSRDVFDVPASSDASTRTWTRVLTLDGIETGEHELPSFSIQVDQNDDRTQLTTRAITIRVASVLEDRSDPTQFRDIRPVIDLDEPTESTRSHYAWIIVGVVLSVLALLIGLVLRRRRREISAAEWAIEQLEDIEPDSNAALQEISQIAFEFLRLQFDVPELGNTPQETVQCLMTSNRIDDEIAARLNQVFAIADQAKFAGLQPSASEIANAIAECRSIFQSFLAGPNLDPTNS